VIFVDMRRSLARLLVALTRTTDMGAAAAVEVQP
jgi:hypothetical protein